MTFDGSFITSHYNSLQSITIHYKPSRFCIIMLEYHYNSLQSITTHYDSLQTSSCFCQHPCQTITVHYNPLQSITIHYNPLRLTKNGSKSPIKPLPISPSHSRNWTIMELFIKFHYGSTYRGRDVMTIVMDRNEISI